MQLIAAGLRVFQVSRLFSKTIKHNLNTTQLIFTIIVLALSVKLAKGQEIGSVPAETGYAAFTGGIGIVAAIVGIAALFVDSLDGLVTLVFDGVSGFALLAGGIVRFDTQIGRDTVTNGLVAFIYRSSQFDCAARAVLTTTPLGIMSCSMVGASSLIVRTLFVAGIRRIS
jgi:hypothetical protein